MTAIPARFSRPEDLRRLIGQAPSFLKAIAQIPAIAGSEASVLISGETGTGKELVAHAIHYLSPRAGFPFVAVNCGSLPDTLLEDELFGHERGAFTHAEARREGLIAQAENGTLFLDEVDTLACKAQVDLLRVLQDRKYRPIGSSREREAHVRIVAATNAPLYQLLHSGNFRTDLYYRLCVFTMTLPPLRERKEDIPVLAAHFLAKHTPAAKQGMQFSACAIEAMQFWDWPGNVRELENAVVRGIHLSQGGVIHATDLGLAVHPDAMTHARPENESFRSMKQATIELFERNYLTKLMSTYKGNVSEAARASGKERRELGKLLKKYRLDAKSFRMQTGLHSPV
ncbi:MAG TPA: sigma-54 dependent transcriptional regulator [Pseudacidobacterium sp.]|jgi:DNA-binding NtrC family response regulator|nr:sigma-54 dependent transcriptional regulator [Pseudacidobacterium sp.]